MSGWCTARCDVGGVACCDWAKSETMSGCCSEGASMPSIPWLLVYMPKLRGSETSCKRVCQLTVTLHGLPVLMHVCACARLCR